MNANRKHEKKDSRKRLWIPALLALLLLLGVTVGPVAAKYLTGRRAPENIVQAYNFYFTSNYLTDASTPPVIHVNAGTTQLDIELYNFDDELRNSDLNIDYTVTITTADTVTTDPVASPASGTLDSANDGTRPSTATITLSNLENGKTYTVTAVGANGFSKTLAAQFVVAADAPLAYKHLDSYDDYVILTVWTKGEAKGNASITYPAGLIPDNTDAAMSVWATGASTGTDSSSFTGYYASHRYRFFRPDTTTTYNIDQFTVSVGSTTAIAATPID